MKTAKEAFDLAITIRKKEIDKALSQISVDIEVACKSGKFYSESRVPSHLMSEIKIKVKEFGYSVTSYSDIVKVQWELDAKQDTQLPTECKCEKCEKNPGEELHTCPYQEDIHGDSTECNCCDSCRHNCAMDI